MNPDPEERFSTFKAFDFQKRIESRIEQLYGWSTDILLRTPIGSFELCLHVMTRSYLKTHGVQQHFLSKHGSEYDDIYSYFQGMNLLLFTAFTQHQLLQDSQIIKALFRENKLSPDFQHKQVRFRRSRSRKISPAAVPVDKPRIGIIIPLGLLQTEWVSGLQDLRIKGNLEITVSNKLEEFIPSTPFNAFIDYSLSRNYQSELKDYIPLLQILETELTRY
jgi:hypothetical protein